MVVVLIQMPYVATTSVTAVQTDTHATKIKAIVSPMCRPSKARTFPLLIFNLRETTLQSTFETVRQLRVQAPRLAASLLVINTGVVRTRRRLVAPIWYTAAPMDIIAISRVENAFLRYLVLAFLTMYAPLEPVPLAKRVALCKMVNSDVVNIWMRLVVVIIYIVVHMNTRVIPPKVDVLRQQSLDFWN